MSIRTFWRELRSAVTHDWERAAVTDARGKIIASIVDYCPDHGSMPTSRMTCHCEIADEIRRGQC